MTITVDQLREFARNLLAELEAAYDPEGTDITETYAVIGAVSLPNVKTLRDIAEGAEILCDPGPLKVGDTIKFLVSDSFPLARTDEECFVQGGDTAEVLVIGRFITAKYHSSIAGAVRIILPLENAAGLIYERAAADPR